MSRDHDHTSHPVLGELRWDAAIGGWLGEYRPPTGGRVDVLVNPGDGDRLAVLEPAADLYKRAIRVEGKILRTAIREELLELYNETWSVGSPRLTASQLAGRLTLAYLELDPDGVVPVTLSYVADDLFAGHAVGIEVDADMNYLDINLVG